ncbi:TPA: ABC transporter permease subunit [Klebsiella michiganensis]|nr:ABC transporter permease subunit [Klebsiella michiganensis]
MKSKTSFLFRQSIGCLIILVIWQWAGMSLGDIMLAPPSAVAAEFIVVLGDSHFWMAVLEMMKQLIAGYVLALIVGIPLGTMMGRSWIVMSVVKPWASMFIVISAAALVPLFILILGRGALMCVSIVFVGTLWYVVTTMQQAAKNISTEFINVGRSFGAGRVHLFRMIILPALFPYVMISARIGFTHALRAMITAQMFISTGFGGLINDAGLDMTTAPLFSLIVTLMLISVLTNYIIGLIAGYCAPWYSK